MLAFHWMHHTFIFDPMYAIDVFNDMWAKEPIGTLSIVLTGIGLTLTLSFKLLDFLWDIYKECARQAKLNIELSLESPSAQAEPQLYAILSNVGKSPIVVRDIGYAPFQLWGNRLHRFQLENATPLLPHTLQAHGLIRIPLASASTAPEILQHRRLWIRDSLGKRWPVSNTELRQARKQVRQWQQAHDRQPHSSTLPPHPSSHPPGTPHREQATHSTV